MTRGEWLMINTQKVRREGVGCREYSFSATYIPELAQALLESDTERIKSAESLNRLKQRVGNGNEVANLI